VFVYRYCIIRDVVIFLFFFVFWLFQGARRKPIRPLCPLTCRRHRHPKRENRQIYLGTLPVVPNGHAAKIYKMCVRTPFFRHQETAVMDFNTRLAHMFTRKNPFAFSFQCLVRSTSLNVASTTRIPASAAILLVRYTSWRHYEESFASHSETNHYYFCFVFVS